jgi:hypothetical protein
MQQKIKITAAHIGFYVYRNFENDNMVNYLQSIRGFTQGNKIKKLLARPHDCSKHKHAAMQEISFDELNKTIIKLHHDD